MTSLASSTTGHSPRKERNVAKTLFLALAVAVVVGMVIAFSAGHKRSLDPTLNNKPEQRDSVPDPAH